MKLFSFLIFPALLFFCLAITACDRFKAECKGCDGESEDSIGGKASLTASGGQSSSGGGGGSGGISGAGGTASGSPNGHADVSVCFELSKGGDLYDLNTSWYNWLEIYFEMENIQPSSLFDSIGTSLSGDRQKDCPFKSAPLFGFSSFGNSMLPSLYYHLIWRASEGPWQSHPVYGGANTQAAYLHKFLEERKLEGHMGVTMGLQENRRAPPPVSVREFVMSWDGGSMVLEIPSNISVTPTVFLWWGGRRAQGEIRNCMEVLHNGTAEEKAQRWHKFENLPLGTFSGASYVEYPGWCY